MSAIKERPILFKGEMVRAILAGRKTQTRRILKFDPLDSYDFASCQENLSRCPYGQSGDRLWVKETFATDGSGLLWWRADGDDQPKAGPWKPSIFMPRWASRITLEIVAVRVERLQEISARDCFAEGIERPKFPNFGTDVTIRDNARNDYRLLWESINGPSSWDRNDWVWCISFRKLENLNNVGRNV